MRLALISDIHGDLTGLNTVLAYIERLGGADGIYALGDMIGIGPVAGGVLDRLIACGAHMLRGNWEDLVLDTQAYMHRATAPWRAFPGVASARKDMSADHLALLRDLPLSRVVEPLQGRRAFFCHAAPADPWSLTCRSDVPAATLRQVYGAIDADLIAYGHFHAPHVIALDGMLLVNVASVGMQADGSCALTLLDFAGGWTVRQFKVPCSR